MTKLGVAINLNTELDTCVAYLKVVQRASCQHIGLTKNKEREDKMMNSVNYLLNMDLGRPWPVKGIASSQLWNKMYEPVYEGSFQGVYILSYKTLATTKEF